MNIWPVVGKAYDTFDSAVADWNHGEDFSMSKKGSGPFVSIKEWNPDIFPEVSIIIQGKLLFVESTVCDFCSLAPCGCDFLQAGDSTDG